MTEKILCVDDDPDVLEGYQRSLGRRFKIDTALGGEEALAAIAQRGPYAVVVADMRMPVMNGIQLLDEVGRRAPDTVRMMLTGNVDQHTAVQAVNDGHVFRFLNKPCEPEDFGKAIQAGLAQYRLITAERELLANTLNACVKLLTDMLSLVNPIAVGRASRLQRLARGLCAEMRAEHAWAIELAAMLSQIGCITIPEATLAKVYCGEPLTEAEQHTYAGHSQIAKELLGRIPRLELVAEIVAHQEDRYDGVGCPPGSPSGEQLPMGSRILKLAVDWDVLSTQELAPDMAMAMIFDRSGCYDPTVVEAMRKIHRIGTVYEVREVRLSDLSDGMILAEDVRSINDTLLCAKGHEITQALRMCLRNYAVNVGLSGPTKVFVPLKTSTAYASH
jgi:response regulator RpfG family c-di-GMP phosphodiesterase